MTTREHHQLDLIHKWTGVKERCTLHAGYATCICYLVLNFSWFWFSCTVEFMHLTMFCIVVMAVVVVNMCFNGVAT